MAIYHPPPSPFVGGRQPLDPDRLPPAIAAVPVEDPPFSGRRAVALDVVRRAWEPEAPLPWLARYVPQGAPLVDAPPVGGRAWLPAVLRAWDPVPFPRDTRRRYVPQPVADAPPVGGRAWLPVVVRAWLPEIVPRELRRRYVPPRVADPPPVGRRAWLPVVRRAWEPPFRVPPQARPFVHVPPVVSAYTPHDRARRLALLRHAWEPPPPPPTRPRTLSPDLLHVRVDRPPFGLRAWLPIVLRAWQPPPHYPRFPVTFTEGGIPPVVDAPPVGGRRWLEVVLRAWEAPPPQPTRPVPFNGQGAGAAPLLPRLLPNMSRQPGVAEHLRILQLAFDFYINRGSIPTGAALAAHEADVANPHQVLGTQVGDLGSATGTSFAAENGSNLAPAFTWQNWAFDGIYHGSSLAQIVVVGNGSQTAVFTSGLDLRGDVGHLRWGPGSNILGHVSSNTRDTGIGRAGVGIVKLTGGDLATAGTWQAGPPSARPAASAALRGTFWHEFNGAGVADTIAICVKDSSDTYVWQTLEIVP